jgi:hypothetical protein
MKLIVAALMLAVATASPALAQKKSKRHTVHTPAPHGNMYAPAYRPRSANPQWDVYRMDGSYAGTDPDPHVRMNLFLDNPHTDD